MFEGAHDVRGNLSNLFKVASDSWVPPADWEAMESAYREVFDGMLQAVLANENPEEDELIKDEGDLRAIWPSDI
jgi:hypothetical protein